MVTCPVCNGDVPEHKINEHLDNNCAESSSSSSIKGPKGVSSKASSGSQIASIFNKKKRDEVVFASAQTPLKSGFQAIASSKRRRDESEPIIVSSSNTPRKAPPTKKPKTNLENAAPLAERLRPHTLTQFVGQSHLTNPDSPLMRMVGSGTTGSMIFWGPPGCGKTTLARLLASKSDAVFKELSATIVGINEVRAVFEEAKGLLTLTGRKTILFMDEVHRFNRAQQDVFLPYVEQGHIQLIGATTENPSFKINGALLSRCRVFVLERLSDGDIRDIVTGAVQRVSDQSIPNTETSDNSHPPSSQPTLVEQQSSQSLSEPVPSSTQSLFPAYPQITHKVLDSIVSLSTGDARTALSLTELAISSAQSVPPHVLIDSLRRSVSTSYDRTGDSHYDLISALHKSVRGSDGTAALYWLARMLEAGEDPVFIARRMVVCSSEDVGLADNHALPLAVATMQACQLVGMPECRINLAHLVSYLSEAPKSTRSYEGYKRAVEAAKQDMTLPVPFGIRNAPTKLMEQLGYGEGYKYNPEYAHPVHNEYLPESLKGQVFLRKAGDISDKVWDEEALQAWEKEKNEGEPWSGRGTR